MRSGGAPDGTLAELPGTLNSLLRTRLIGLRAKIELARLMGRPERLTRAVAPGSSVAEWIASRSRNADVRSMLRLFARVSNYCEDLDDLDATAGVAQIVQALTHGVVYLDGGWQQLVDGLYDVVRCRGVVVQTRAKVEAVELRDGAWTVHTAAGDFDAAAVVFAGGGPADVDAMLHGASTAVARWARDERPVVATTLDLALRSLPVPTRRITFALDEPIYCSVHTPYAQLAPTDGGEVVHLLWYGEADRDPRRRLESLLDRAQPGWWGHLVEARYGRRLVVAHGRPLPGRGLAGRASVAVPDLPNLFVAGDWVGPEGLLTDAVFASGRAAGLAAATRPAMLAA